MTCLFSTITMFIVHVLLILIAVAIFIALFYFTYEYVIKRKLTTPGGNGYKRLHLSSNEKGSGMPGRGLDTSNTRPLLPDESIASDHEPGRSDVDEDNNPPPPRTPTPPPRTPTPPPRTPTPPPPSPPTPPPPSPPTPPPPSPPTPPPPSPPTPPPPTPPRTPTPPPPEKTELTQPEKDELRTLVRGKMLERLDEKPASHFENKLTPEFTQLESQLENKLKEDFTAAELLTDVTTLEDVLRASDRSYMFDRAGINTGSMTGTTNAEIANLKSGMTENLAAQMVVDAITNKSVTVPKGLAGKEEGAVVQGSVIGSAVNMSREIGLDSLIDGFLEKRPESQILSVNRFGVEYDFEDADDVKFDFFSSVNGPNLQFRRRETGDGLSDTSIDGKVEYLDFYVTQQPGEKTVVDIKIINRCKDRSFSIMPCIFPVGGMATTSIWHNFEFRSGTFLYVACGGDRTGFYCKVGENEDVTGMVIDLMVLGEKAPQELLDRDTAIMTDDQLLSIFGPSLATMQKSPK
nr:MAG: hypothetical protein [White spot syndrome virus]